MLLKYKSSKSVEGKEILSFSNTEKKNKVIALIAGVHGDEPEGVYVLENWLKWLKCNAPTLPLLVFPCINPDGIKNNTRQNSNKVDLNRNLPTEDWSAFFEKERYHPGPSPLSEPENIFLIETLNDFDPQYIISFHSWKRLLNFNGGGEDLVDMISNINNYPKDPDIGYPTPGSFGSYASNRYNCPVLTYELPTIEKLTLKKVWGENKDALCSMPLASKLASYIQ